MRCVKEEQKGKLKRTRKELHMERSWRGGRIGMCEEGTDLMPST